MTGSEIRAIYVSWIIITIGCISNLIEHQHHIKRTQSGLVCQPTRWYWNWIFCQTAVDITYLISYNNLCRKTNHVFGGTRPLDTPSHIAQHPPTHGEIVWIPSAGDWGAWRSHGKRTLFVGRLGLSEANCVASWLVVDNHDGIREIGNV